MYAYPVVNGYDPNDKKVFPQGICDEKFVQQDEELFYTIRFQNTGNSEAINIVVKDTIDSSLDMSTVQLVAKSHTVVMTGTNGNVLQFEFDGINLPDSTSNEPLSHGYVIFKIKPLTTSFQGAPIFNKAEIYFDYNPPIVTNGVANKIFIGDLDTLICGTVVTVGELAPVSDQLDIYPNPFRDVLHISADEILLGEIMEVVDIYGRIRHREAINQKSFDIQLSQLESGIYFFRVNTLVKKVLKN